MQNANLPNLSSASAAPAPSPPRANANADTNASGARQFSQALSREVAQRQNSGAPAAQAAKPAHSSGQPSAQQQAQNASEARAASGRTEVQRPPPKTASVKSGDDSAKAEDDASADETAAAAAATPVTDMLALVASFNLPPANAATPGLAQVDAAGSGADAASTSAPASASASALASASETASTASASLAASTASAVASANASFKSALAGAVDAKTHGATEINITDTKNALAIALPDAARKTEGMGAAANGAPADGLASAAKGALADPLAAAAPKHQPKAEARAEAPAADAAVPDARPLAAAAAQPAFTQPTLTHARDETPAQAAAKDPVAAIAPAAPLVAQSALAVAQAAAAAGGDKLAARVGTPGWDNQVGQKIVWMVAGKEQSAEMTLNPPDMGPMQIVLSVTNDQASVTFTAAQPEVRQALEAAMPKLREMMSESGIALGNATVNAGMPDQRQAQGEQPRAGLGNGGSRFNPGADNSSVAAVRPASRAEHLGLVDTFA